MKRSDTLRMTSAYFAAFFSRGYFYAGFFGYAEYDSAAVDALHRGSQPIPV